MLSDLLLLGKIDGIYDTNYSAVDGAILVSICHAGRGAAHHDHLLVIAGTDGIDRDKIAALVRAIEIDRLDDEQLFSMQAFVFLSGHDSAQDSGNYHLSGQCSVAGGQ